MSSVTDNMERVTEKKALAFIGNSIYNATCKVFSKKDKSRQ